MCDAKHMKTLNYLIDCDPEKEEYKKYLCYLCGYPEVEWMRVADVQVEQKSDDDCLTFTVKFANPGKHIELYNAGLSGGLVDPRDIDEEAWALIKTMLAKLASGDVSTESRKSVVTLT